jgi:hypothetical protein
MKLTQAIKILVGLGTLWYIIYPFLFVGVIFLIMLGSLGFVANLEQNQVPFFITPIFLILPLHCLTILLALALLVFYFVHLVKNKEGSETARILLGLGFFILPQVAMPFYYFTYVWPDTPPAWAMEKQPTA